MTREFHKPYIIQFSAVSYDCNRACPWCGIRTLHKDVEPKYMSKTLAEKAAMDISEWTKKIRLDFSSFGEPLLNKHLYDIISIFHNSIDNPWITVYTNGTLVDYDTIEEFFRSGGNLLNIDPYDIKTYNKILDIINRHRSDIEKMGVRIVFYDSKTNNFRFYDHHGKKKKFLMISDTVNEPEGVRGFHNMADNVDVRLVKKLGVKIDLTPKPHKYCTRPFRELVMKADGVVCLCCYDWKNDCVIAKYPEDGSIEEIWYSPAMMAIRSILRYHRTIPPCNRCSYHGGFRIGLEPKIDFDGPEEFLLRHQEKYKHLKLPGAKEWKTKRRSLREIMR